MNQHTLRHDEFVREHSAFVETAVPVRIIEHHNNRNLMIWCTVLISIVQIASSRNLFAEDYLLQLDTFGYEDATEEVPRETLLRSISIVVQPNVKFRTKSVHADPSMMKIETSKLHGEFRPAEEDGRFILDLSYTQEVDKGETFPTVNGRSPVLDITSYSGKWTLQMDQPILAGGFETRSGDQKGKILRSKHRGIVTLKRISEDSD